ncbi:MAG TPA: hypothetical protein VHR66_01890 [Gemmataceae bacterium]|nr:hypothetical protein [Gemmataceae bacterium]
MVSVKISGAGSGICALSARDGDGLTVAFENDQPLFLSWKSFKQLLSLKLGAHGKAPPPTKSVAPGNEGK